MTLAGYRPRREAILYTDAGCILYEVELSNLVVGALWEDAQDGPAGLVQVEPLTQGAPARTAALLRETQNIQSFNWSKWRCALKRYLTSCLLSRPNVISDVNFYNETFMQVRAGVYESGRRVWHNTEWVEGGRPWIMWKWYYNINWKDV